MKKFSLIGKILILFKWFDIPITLFFVGILTVIGIFGSWVFVIVLIVLMAIGMVSSFVAILVGDYLDEQQTLKKNPYSVMTD